MIFIILKRLYFLVSFLRLLLELVMSSFRVELILMDLILSLKNWNTYSRII